MVNTEPTKQATTIASSQAVRDIVGRKKLAELMRRKDLPGLLFFSFHFACLLSTGSLLYLSLESTWFFPAMALHGFIIVRLFAPYHEGSHGTTFKSKWLNDSFYWLTGLILILPPLAFKYEHADHHTYTQDPERDSQFIKADNIYEYLWYGSAIPYFFNIARNILLQPFGWMNDITRRVVPESERKKVQREAWVFWCVYLILILISIWLQTWAIVIFWLAPRILMEPIERLIRMTEHVCCAKSPDMMDNSRTVIVNPILSVLSWYMPHHSAHHAVPLVPFHALSELSNLLKEEIKHYEYGMTASIIREMKILIKDNENVGETQ